MGRGDFKCSFYTVAFWPAAIGFSEVVGVGTVDGMCFIVEVADGIREDVGPDHITHFAGEVEKRVGAVAVEAVRRLVFLYQHGHSLNDEA